MITAGCQDYVASWPGVMPLAQVTPSGSIPTSQFLMLAGAILALTFVMISTRRRIRATRADQGPSARETYRRLSQETETKRDLEAVMLELDQLSRQTMGRLDTKFAKLEAVIRDADERIATLTRLLRDPGNDPPLDLTVADEEPASVRKTPAEPNTSVEPRHAAVYQLADAGLSALDIARELDRTTGEIELILSLRRTRQTVTSTYGPTSE